MAKPPPASSVAGAYDWSGPAARSSPSQQAYGNAARLGEGDSNPHIQGDDLAACRLADRPTARLDHSSSPPPPPPPPPLAQPAAEAAAYTRRILNCRGGAVTDIDLEAVLARIRADRAKAEAQLRAVQSRLDELASMEASVTAAARVAEQYGQTVQV